MQAMAIGKVSAAAPVASRAALTGRPGREGGASSRWILIIAAGPPAVSAAD